MPKLLESAMQGLGFEFGLGQVYGGGAILKDHRLSHVFIGPISRL